MFPVDPPRFVSNKTNPRCAISLNRSPFPAGLAFKVRMKDKARSAVLAGAATSRIRLDPDM
jgi:hypothetical protein